MGWGLRPRLAALVAVTGTVVAAAALGALVLVLGHQLDAAVDEGLRARANDLVAATIDGDLTASHHDPFAQVVAPGGRVVAGSVNAPSTSVLDADELRAASRHPLTVVSTVPPLRGAARLRAERAGRYVVVVGTGLAEFDSARRRLLVVLGSSLVVLVALLTAGAWFLVGAALRPVARMSLAAKEMSDPHGQLPEARGHDELALLSRTLNELLERIGALLDRERAFLDDASHELRTPLTVLRGELELALEDPDPASVRRGVQAALTEAERLSALASDLLVLARQRGGGLTLDRTDVQLASWIAASVHGLPAALRLDIAVEVVGDITASIDTSRMERVLINLLNNAMAAGAHQVRISAFIDGSGGHRPGDDRDRGGGRRARLRPGHPGAGVRALRPGRARPVELGRGVRRGPRARHRGGAGGRPRRHGDGRQRLRPGRRPRPGPPPLRLQMITVP